MKYNIYFLHAFHHKDRAHRIGQRNSVRVFRLITYSPVEEKILSRATEKLNMSEIVVEAGKFDKSSVEEDNSQERRKMMEILLTDFDTTAGASIDESDSQEGEGAEDVDVLNEMISNNDDEYELYCNIDKERNVPGLLDDPNEIPDWIKYPKGQKKTSSEKWDQFMADETTGKRKRTSTGGAVYDDGLTELQFIRMMEKQADEEETAAKKKKERSTMRKEDNESIDDKDDKQSLTEESLSTASRLSRIRKSTSRGVEATSPNGNGNMHQTIESEPIEGLADKTYRKLINACKTVIALRESVSKRRLSEIFLEKPCPKTYPDYYQVIKKPIAINDILKKCRAHKYNELFEFWSDWKLLFENARKYNADVSVVS